MGVTPSRIELHIEHLLVDGFPDGAGPRIARALEGELGRLLVEGGLPAGLRRGADTARVPAQSFPVTRRSDATAIGADAACAVYRGLRA